MKSIFFKSTALLFLVGCSFLGWAQRISIEVHVAPAEEDVGKKDLIYQLTCIETQQRVKTNDRGGAILNLNSTDHVMICLDGICVVADLSSFKDWNFSSTNERTEITLVFYYPQHVQKAVEVSAYAGILKNIESPANIGIARMNILSQGDHSSLQNVLNTIPGVTYESRGYGGSQRINIRGSMLRSPFGVRNVRVYYDGYTITSPDGTTPFEVIDPSWMESIEVYKGPIGYQFGNGTGGVIAYQSKKNWSGLRALSYDMTLGSFGYQRFNLSTQFPIFSNAHNARTIGIRCVDQSTSGYREQEWNKRKSVELKYNKRITRHWSQWRGGSNNKELGNNGILFQYHQGSWGLPGSIKAEDWENDPRQARTFAVQNNTRLERERWMLGGSLDRNLSEHWKSSFRVSKQVALKTNPYGTNPNYQGWKDEASRSLNERFTLQYQRGVKDSLGVKQHECSVNIGQEFQNEQYSITERNILNGERGAEKYEYHVHYQQSFFWLGAQYKWRDRIHVDVGTAVHWTKMEVNGQYVGAGVENHSFTWKPKQTPRLSSSIRLWEQQFLYYSKGWGFSNPNVFEQVDYDNKRYNANLTPEWGIQDEWGWKGSIDGWEWTVCHYQQNVSSIILAQNTTSETLGSYQNAGSIVLNGWEALISKGWQFGRKKDWNIMHSMSYHKTKYSFSDYQEQGIQYAGMTLPGNALNILNGTIQIQWKDQWEFTFNDYWSDKMFLNNSNTQSSDPFHLLNASIFRGWYLNERSGYIGISFGINNVLNTTYSSFNQLNDAFGRYYNPAPVRNFYASIRWSLSSFR